MLGILIDIAVLATLLFFVDREEASDVFNLVVAVMLMTIADVVIALALVPQIGLPAIAPMMLVGLLVIRWRFTLTWKKTLIVLAGFTSAKVLSMLAFSAMLNS